MINILNFYLCKGHNITKLAGMVVTATQRLKKLEVDLNTFQIGQNDISQVEGFSLWVWRTCLARLFLLLKTFPQYLHLTWS